MAEESKSTPGFKLSCGTCTHTRLTNNDTLNCDNCSLTQPQVAESKSGLIDTNPEGKGGSRKYKKKSSKRKTQKRKRRTKRHRRSRKKIFN